LQGVITSASNSSVKPERARPRESDLAHAVLGAADARHARAEVGLVLEEVEVAT
jgi:hypothetical protein